MEAKNLILERDFGCGSEYDGCKAIKMAIAIAGRTEAAAEFFLISFA
jgi:hypothetical protein